MTGRNPLACLPGGPMGVLPRPAAVAAGIGKRVFGGIGADQHFVVPAGVTKLRAKIWGAGGGHSNDTGVPALGCAGGYTQAVIDVTPGEVLTVIVGQGGTVHTSASATKSYGGGGGVPSPSGGAKGGGRSAIRRGATELATAGGGGGTRGQSWELAPHGVGGGETGGSGGWPFHSGSGGTATAGGVGATANGASPGTQFEGGNGQAAVAMGTAGGGGGYFGGGGANIGVGGGGSGYVGGPGVTGTTTAPPAGAKPPNDTDPDYLPGIGAGGPTGNPGGPGLIVLEW